MERQHGKFSAQLSCLKPYFLVRILPACIRSGLWTEDSLTVLNPGFSVSFGVSQNYYTKLPEFKGNPYIPIVGTMASGIPYLGGPVMAVFVRRYQHYRLYIIWIGWPLCILGLIAGSFASSLGPLIFTQGIMYGGECKSLSHVVYLILTWALAGFVIFYYPISSIVNEWWIAHRGMAFGVITSAAGASGIAMPLITEALLDRYGYRTTLRAIAVAMIVLTGPPIPPMRSRLPPSHASAVTRTAWSFASKSLFLVYCFANFTQGFGFFFPSLFLPSYANSIGLNARQGAMLLSLMRPHK